MGCDNGQRTGVVLYVKYGIQGYGSFVAMHVQQCLGHLSFTQPLPFIITFSFHSRFDVLRHQMFDTLHRDHSDGCKRNKRHHTPVTQSIRTRIRPMARIPCSRDDSLVRARYACASELRRRATLHAFEKRRHRRLREAGSDGGRTDVSSKVRSDARIYDCVDDCSTESAADGSGGEGEAGGCGEKGVGSCELDACD